MKPIKKFYNKYEFLKICEYELKQAFLKYVDAYIAYNDDKIHNK